MIENILLTIVSLAVLIYLFVAMARPRGVLMRGMSTGEALCIGRCTSP